MTRFPDFFSCNMSISLENECKTIDNEIIFFFEF